MATDAEYTAFVAANKYPKSRWEFEMLQQQQRLVPGADPAPDATLRYWSVDLTSSGHSGNNAAVLTTFLNQALGAIGDPVDSPSSLITWVAAQVDDAYAVITADTLYIISNDEESPPDWPMVNGSEAKFLNLDTISTQEIIQLTAPRPATDFYTKVQPTSANTLFTLTSQNLTNEGHPNPAVSSVTAKWFKIYNGLNADFYCETGSGFILVPAGKEFEMGPTLADPFVLSGFKITTAANSGTLRLVAQR